MVLQICNNNKTTNYFDNFNQAFTSLEQLPGTLRYHHEHTLYPYS